MPQRTFANTWNLGLMAALAYKTGSFIRTFFNSRFQNYRTRSSIQNVRLDARDLPPIVRPAPDADQATEDPIAVKFVDERDDIYDTQLFATATSAYVLVAVRGTEGARDILDDLVATPETWTGPGLTLPSTDTLQVPIGFLTQFLVARDSLRRALTGQLQVNQADRRPIFITGHSLGGAVATLIACWMRSETGLFSQDRHIHLYTYAQPRNADLNMATAYWEPASSRFRPTSYHRFALANDGVPMVPRQVLAGCLGGCPYRHFGQLQVIRAGEGAILATATGVESPALIDAQSLTGASPSAHFMVTSYLRGIQREFRANYTRWASGGAGAVPFTDDREELDRVNASTPS